MPKRKHFGDINIAPKNSIGDTHPHVASWGLWAETPGIFGDTTPYVWHQTDVTDQGVYAVNSGAALSVSDPDHDVEITVKDSTGTQVALVVTAFMQTHVAGSVTSYTVPGSGYTVNIVDNGPYFPNGTLMDQGNPGAYTPTWQPVRTWFA